MDFSVLVDHYPKLFSGALVTIELLVHAIIWGCVLAVPLGLMRSSQNKWVTVLPTLYIFFFRGTPLLVQIFLIYYGASQFSWIRESVLWQWLQEPYWCAIIAFTLNNAAYSSEILRGALQNIPKGEVEAAKALGMPVIKRYQRILLPRAFGIMLPAYGNEIILMLKGTALASTITLLDLTGAARTIIAKTYTPIEVFMAAGAVYLFISIVIIQLFKQVEKRQNRYLLIQNSR